MSDDAFFQSGMGAVDAPRTEDFLARPAFEASARIAGRVLPRRRPGLFARAPMAARFWGNSAKALIERRIPGTIPS